MEGVRKDASEGEETKGWVWVRWVRKANEI